MAETGEIVRALRKALNLKQQEVAARGGVLRSHLAMVEIGHNQASSYKTRSALAKGFGLTLEEVANLLAGKLSVRRAKALITARANDADAAPFL
jgi:transcriptional regulator with XRE-family HTH domain